MKRILLAFAVAVIALCERTGVTLAQDASLALVPAKAPIVVQLNGFEKARNKLGKFLGNALPDLAPKLIQQIDNAIKEAAEGRDLKAVTKDGRVYLIVNELENLTDNPHIAVLAPVTSFAEFKGSFLKEAERKNLKKRGDGIQSVQVDGKEITLYLAERKEYVYVGNDLEAAKAFVTANDGGLDKMLAPDIKAAFLKQDLAVYADIKAINKQFGEQIKAFKMSIEMGFDGGGIDKKQTEQIKQVFSGLLQLIDDAVAAVIGIDFRDEGVNVKFAAQFGAETDTNGFLKKLKPAALSELGSLPAGQLVYSASNFDPSHSKTLAAILKDANADDEDVAAKKVIDEVSSELIENSRTIELAAGDILNRGALEIAIYKDCNKAVNARLRLMKALTKTASFGGVPLKSKPAIAENAESLGSFKFHQIKMEFDFDKAVEKLPEEIRAATRASLVRFSGDKGISWIGTDGSKVINVSAKDWKDAKAVVDQYLQGKATIAKDESFQSTRKNLPSEATVFFIADTARLVEMMLDAIRDITQGVPGAIPGGQIPPIKAPKAKPAYFGFALVLKSEYGSVDLYVPTVAVQQVRKMIAPLLDKDN